MDFMLLSFQKELNITTPHHLATWLDPYSHLVHPVHHPTAKDWKTTGPDLPEDLPINLYNHRHHFHYCSQCEILRTEVALATSPPHHFYRTRVRSLVMLVSNSLTDWLTNSCLVNLMPVNDAVCCLHLAKAVKLSPAGFTTNILSWQGKLLKHKLLCFDKIL